MRDSDYKSVLLDSLESENVTALMKLLNQMTGKRCKTLAGYLNQMSADTLFGLLHRELFGGFDQGEQAYKRILDNLGLLKERLRKISLYPPILYQMKVKNEVAGEVIVTVHAWERFCQRFHHGGTEQEVVAKSLIESFARARATALSKYHEVVRLLNNELAVAEYFLDKKLNCRFVVSVERNLKSLMTVEIPH